MAPNTRQADTNPAAALPTEDKAKKIIPEDAEVLKGRVMAIRRAIRHEEKKLFQNYPWLVHQDAIGAAIFLGSLAVCLGTAYCYWNGYLSAIPTILLIAFFVGLLHELEHDLIHDLYFKHSILIQDIMFTGIWLAKGHINPWYRRRMHLAHHARSGQPDDIEERAIGLGLPFSWMRIGICVNMFTALLLSKQIKKDNPSYSVVELLTCSFPVTTPVFALTFILYLQSAGLFETLVTADPYWFDLLWKIQVVYIIPNIWRQACLVLMSSYCHYYEDLPEGGDGLFYQNQILDSKWLLPFQLFCCNFGSTHIIHHYITNQPFYVREMIKDGAHKAMAENKVRINDFSIVARANRFDEQYPGVGWFKGFKKVWRA